MKKISILLLALIAGISAVFAQDAEPEETKEQIDTHSKKSKSEENALDIELIALRKRHHNVNKHHVAIEGYDAVAYQTLKQAIKGNPGKAYEYKGLVYYFMNDENMFRFKVNPAIYEPAYGGWDAYSMKDGKKVKSNPETFKIIHDKLYLFYNFKETNTLDAWQKHEAYLKGKADEHWKKFMQIEP